MNRRRGITVLFAVAAVALVAALATALVATSIAADRLARRAELDVRLLNAAESGGELALQRLAADGARPGALKLAVPGGTAAVVIEKAGGAWRISSTAATRTRSCRVTIGVALATGGKWRVTAWQATYSNR